VPEATLEKAHDKKQAAWIDFHAAHDTRNEIQSIVPPQELHTEGATAHFMFCQLQEHRLRSALALLCFP